MNILSGQIRENQGLNAKGWDRAHTSREGLWLMGLVREARVESETVSLQSKELSRVFSNTIV